MDPLMVADRLVMAAEGAPPSMAVVACRARELGVVGSRAVCSGLVGLVWLGVCVEFATEVPVVTRAVSVPTAGRETAGRVRSCCAADGCVCA